MKRITTTYQTINEDDDQMTGTEQYPIIGRVIIRSQYDRIISSLVGLRREWDCLDKAKRAQSILNTGRVALGSLHVFNHDYSGTYGFNYNPPYEFHAWIEIDDKIVDFALPGVIEAGLKAKDHIGYLLTKRKPAVLAGTPPDWTKYKRFEYLDEYRTNAKICVFSLTNI